MKIYLFYWIYSHHIPLTMITNNSVQYNIHILYVYLYEYIILYSCNMQYGLLHPMVMLLVIECLLCFPLCTRLCAAVLKLFGPKAIYLWDINVYFIFIGGEL